MNINIPADWANCAVPSLRAILAEAVTAEIAERIVGPDSTTWFGGQNAAFDVSSVEDDQTRRTVRRDAKSVRLEHKDERTEVVLARTNAQRYDSAKVDVITLIHLGETVSGFEVDLEQGTAAGAATARILDVWDIPVARMNELLAEINEERGDRQIRNCLLFLDDIEEFRIEPRSV